MKVMRGCARAAVGLVVALGAVGCSGGGSAEVTPLPSTSAGSPVVGSTAVVATAAVVVTSASDVTVDATDVTQAEGSTPPSSEPATTDDSTTTSTVLPDGFVGLSPDGPWQLVDSAPGVDTPGLVYELMPKLWAFLPTEEVPDDGNLFVPLPDDIPIIEAYLQSRVVMYSALEHSPFDFDSPGWSRFYVDSGASYRADFAVRDEAGEVLDRDVGVVLRPAVLGDGRTESTAIVFDCTLDGAVWRAVDGGLGEGSIPGSQPDGVAAEMQVGVNGWQLASVAQQAEACV